MKKALCLLILFSLIVGVCTSCDLHSDESPNSRKESVVVTIISDGEVNKTEQIYVGSKNIITLPVKYGYICTGLYSDKTGGVKYFDEDGDSTMLWQKNFPTTLYAQFESIIGKTYVSDVYLEEDPTYINFYSGDKTTVNLPQDFKAALSSNTSLSVQVTFTYEITGTCRKGNTVKSYITSSGNLEGEMARENYMASFTSFTQKSLTTTCKAKQLLNTGSVYFIISTALGYEDVRIKNIQCKLTIVE